MLGKPKFSIRGIPCNKCLIHIIKFMYLLIIMMFLFGGLIGNFNSVLTTAMKSIVGYFVFTLICFVYLTNENDKDFLVKSLIMYVSAVFILGNVFISTFENITTRAIDYEKTTLNYKIGIKASPLEIENVYQDYNKSVDSYMSLYEFTDLSTIMKKSLEVEQKNKDKSKIKVNIFLNFAPALIITITLLMFLWSFKSLSIFKCRKDVSLESLES